MFVQPSAAVLLIRGRLRPHLNPKRSFSPYAAAEKLVGRRGVPPPLASPPGVVIDLLFFFLRLLLRRGEKRRTRPAIIMSNWTCANVTRTAGSASDTLSKGLQFKDVPKDFMRHRMLCQQQTLARIAQNHVDNTERIRRWDETLTKSQRDHIARGEAEYNDRRSRIRAYNGEMETKTRSAHTIKEQRYNERQERFFKEVDKKMSRANNFCKYREELMAVVPPEPIPIRRPSTAPR